MTDTQEDYLSMFLTVSGFFREEEARITAIIPAFAGLQPLFEARVDSILMLGSESDMRLTGYAKDKQNRRERLEEYLTRVGSAAVLHHTHTAPDAEMAERLARSLSQYKKQSTADLLANSRFVWETADGFKTLLAPFSVSAAQVDEMAVAIGAFEDMRTTPRDVRAVAKRKRTQMEQEINDLRLYLRKVLDVLLRNLEFSDRVLYYTYRSTRKVRKNRGKRSEKSPDKIFINPGSTKELVLRNPVTSADDALHLSSHSKAAEGDAVFYYSATPAGEQVGEGLSLAAGTRQSTTAGALGFNEERKHLCVRNTAMQRHVVGVARAV